MESDFSLLRCENGEKRTQKQFICCVVEASDAIDKVRLTGMHKTSRIDRIFFAPFVESKLKRFSDERKGKKTKRRSDHEGRAAT